MRIIAGKWRGKSLASLGSGDPHAHLRPTSDRTRESLFNVLAHASDDPLTDARVLDLFAGTGALGLEALSRGAAHATFVDNGAKALGLLHANIERLGAEDLTTVVKRDALRLPENPGQPHSLIFLDPPYGKGLGSKALAAAKGRNWIAPAATVVWEERDPMEPPDGFNITSVRRYGDTHVAILRAW